MENTAFREQLDLYGAAFEKVLAEYLQSVRFRPDVLDESVRYSLQSGGRSRRISRSLRVLSMFLWSKYDFSAIIKPHHTLIGRGITHRIADLLINHSTD